MAYCEGACLVILLGGKQSQNMPVMSQADLDFFLFTFFKNLSCENNLL